MLYLSSGVTVLMLASRATTLHSCQYVNFARANYTDVCTHGSQCCFTEGCCNNSSGSPWYVWLALGLGALAVGVFSVVYHRYRYRHRNRVMESVREEIAMTCEVSTSHQPHWLRAVSNHNSRSSRPLFVQPPAGSRPPPMPMPYFTPGQPPPYSPTNTNLLPPPPPYGLTPAALVDGGPPPEPLTAIDDEQKALTSIQPMQPAYRMPSAKDDDRPIADIASIHSGVSQPSTPLNSNVQTTLHM